MLDKQHLHIIAPEADIKSTLELIEDIQALSSKYEITFEVRTELNSLAPNLPSTRDFSRYDD